MSSLDEEVKAKKRKGSKSSKKDIPPSPREDRQLNEVEVSSQKIKKRKYVCPVLSYNQHVLIFVENWRDYREWSCGCCP